jgi:hypothetical protein
MAISDLIRTEPFATFFTLYKLSVVLLKLPFWIVFYIRRANRPRGSWSLTKAVTIRGLRDLTGAHSLIFSPVSNDITRSACRLGDANWPFQRS